MSRPSWSWATLTAGLLLLLFVVGNGLWLQQDRVLRDGDEEGHVGAAELFLYDLEQRDWGGAVDRAFRQDMGDYPSLYPALVGGWWYAARGAQPGRPAVRSVNLLLLLLTGAAIAGVAWRAGCGSGASLLAGAAVLFLPLNAGLARHFMPEVALSAAVALAVLAAAWQRERASLSRALLLGLACGLGVLTKQTFPLYAALPVLLLVRWRWSLLAALAGASTCLPWLLTNLEEQQAYASGSIAYTDGLAGALSFYPVSLWSPSLGPVWLLLLAASAVLALKGPMSRLAGFGLAWTFGGLLLLLLIPKKYDRLLAPLLPGLGLVIAAAVQARPRAAPLALAGAGWTLTASFTPLAQPTAFAWDFHPGCPQVWLRPPQPDDLGLSAIAEAAREAGPGPIAVWGEPALIPCTVQTTHPWLDHVAPYLRRDGEEREVLLGGEGPVVVDWSGGTEGDRVVELPSLGASFALRSLTPVKR